MDMHDLGLWQWVFLLLFFLRAIVPVHALHLEHRSDVRPYSTGQTIEVEWVKDRDDEPPSFNLLLYIFHERSRSSVTIRLTQSLSTNSPNPFIDIVIPRGYPGPTPSNINTYVAALQYTLIAVSPDETETYGTSEKFHVGAEGELTQLFSSPPLQQPSDNSNSSDGNNDDGSSGGSSPDSQDSSSSDSSSTGNDSSSGSGSSGTGNSADASENTTSRSSTSSTTSLRSTPSRTPSSATTLLSVETVVSTRFDPQGNAEVTTVVVPAVTETVSAAVGATASSGLPIGAIVGIAIAGFITLLLLIAILFLLCRRRKIRRTRAQVMRQENQITPIVLPAEAAPPLERPREKYPDGYAWTNEQSLSGDVDGESSVQDPISDAAISYATHPPSDTVAAAESSVNVQHGHPTPHDFTVMRLEAEVQMLRDELQYSGGLRSATPPPEYRRRSELPPPV